MNYGISKSHQLYAAPQMLVQHQPQLQPPPPQAATGHLYYYSTANPLNTSSTIVFAVKFTTGNVLV
ncbi:hypothetical protein KFK09_009167 [Dendrobium nobile]|uniref:Uncharacterized protein n=1 Tax=Dendrobium nobile TaxID=94219 RepID=A0A8T3BMM9_DENNO|nr:hypothetical protein KFK09_009167 [Dendrobium nobile]